MEAKMKATRKAKAKDKQSRATEGPPSERRSRRSTCLVDALRYQLDACRADEGLSAIVVSDEIGFCVAHSGGDGTHDDLAAQLPVLADPARRRSLDGDDLESVQTAPESLVIKTFSVRGATLHACAVGTPTARRPGGRGDGVAVLARVASGFSRLLAE
jgi:hypothetical protein